MDKLFSNKRTYIDKNGNTLINMCIPSLDISKMESNGYVKLSKSDEGRIDKFAYNCISTDIDSAIDEVLYYNHIFNPFSIQEGDLLYTPVLNDNHYVKKDEPILPDNTKVSDNFSGSKPKTYAETVEYLANLGFGVS